MIRSLIIRVGSIDPEGIRYVPTTNVRRTMAMTTASATTSDACSITRLTGVLGLGVVAASAAAAAGCARFGVEGHGAT